MNNVVLLEGFVMGLSLIVAIGAQNAFVLKQGIKREHRFLVALTCVICDVFLIIVGVSGLGTLFEDFPKLEIWMRWGGALFLAGYALRSFYSVFHPHKLIASLDEPQKQGWIGTFLMLLAFTFLNPHTYVDTMLLLGTVGGEKPPHEHLPFIIGASVASVVWFFSLTYGASALSNYFRNPRVWQVFDTLIGSAMLAIAVSLVLE